MEEINEGKQVYEENMAKITVKFKGKSIPVAVMLDSPARDLKSILQPLTDVLPRGQKLIFKGKVLEDGMTLRESGLKDKATIMLIATQGLHQGDGPLFNRARFQDRSQYRDEVRNKPPPVSVDTNRLERWKLTGVIALSDCNLKTIPDEVWACADVTRVLEVSNNYIQDVPAKIASLGHLQKLLLNGNDISDDSIHWKEVASLKRLTFLSVGQNNLTSLPSDLGCLTALRQLRIDNNKLSSLPTEIGLLSHLEILKANNNRISSIPPSIRNCASLIEVDLSSNLLAELPDSVGDLLKLKVLSLSNNGLKSLPGTLFKMCLQLSTLDLHNTEVTVETLRQFEGWEAFEIRRRAKHQKQLDCKVVGSTDFDEGADKD